MNDVRTFSSTMISLAKLLLSGIIVGIFSVFSLNSALAAPLTSTNVQPASLVAGATSVVTATFTTTTDIPDDGKIWLQFGAGFNASGATSGTCSTMDGTFTTVIYNSVTVIIERNGDGTIQTGAAESCTVNGIINQGYSGSTGTYTLQTTNGGGATIDVDNSVSADTITPGALTSTNVQPASTRIYTTNTVTLTFTMANPLENNGSVKVDFPVAFDVSGAASATCSTMDGGFTTFVTGQLVYIIRNGAGTSEPAGAQTCTIGGIRNPLTVGTGGTYSIQTEDSTSAIHDRDLAVTADTFSAPSSSGSSSVSTALTYTVSVSAPAATAAFMSGDEVQVAWITGGTGSASAVDLSYSTNGGLSYTSIVTGTANDGSYTWTAPSISEQSVTVRVQTTDLVTVLATAMSGAFSISTATPGEDVDTSAGSTTLLPTGTFIKGESWNTVYYIDGVTRRPFLDSQTFFTYVDNFDGVIETSDDYLSNFTIGSPMLPKAGTVLVKIQSVSKVYALGDSGELHWLTSESLATALYGSKWADYVIDVPVTAWSHFTVGSDISDSSDWTVDSSLLQKRSQLNSK